MMERFMTIALASFLVSAVPALALDETDRQRLNGGEGCPGCDLSGANLNGGQLQN